MQPYPGSSAGRARFAAKSGIDLFLTNRRGPQAPRMLLHGWGMKQTPGGMSFPSRRVPGDCA